MGKRNIEKYSFRYAGLKTIISFWHNKVFYRKIIVLNKDRIPADAHTIFTPNHQNALMDALAVLSVRRWQPVFLARSDIYRKKFIAKMLYSLKILPVYRIRDGFDTLKNNQQIFQKTIDVIRNKNGLVILPEGNHDGHRRLRPLKKGVARIAFQTEESTGFSLNIQIIPVGIDYSSYQKFRHTLTVNFGDPIPVSDFYELYQENQGKAINALMKRIREGMKKVMVHIETEEYYGLYEQMLRIMMEQKWFPPRENISRQRELVGRLDQILEEKPAEIEEMNMAHKDLSRLTKKHNVRYWLLRKGPFTTAGYIQRCILLLVGFPVFLAGLIPNAPIFLLPLRVSKKLKDPQFVSSINFGISAVLFITVYLVYFLILLVAGLKWWIALLAVAALLPLGLIAFMYSSLWKKTRGSWQFRRKWKTHPKDLCRMQEAYNGLLQQVKELMKRSK